MKRIILMLLTCLSILLLSGAAFADRLNVVTTYPYIASIAQEIGGDHIAVNALARGDYDPHMIVPRPSYIAKLRQADLLVINGAQLEIGWLPPLIKQANNPVIMPGQPGFLDLSGFVRLIDVPDNVSRELGDVHPEGNPHFCLDPRNIPPVAEAIAARLETADPQHVSIYRANLGAFLSRWGEKQEVWDEAMGRLREVPVIEYHRLYDYFLARYGMTIAGTIEPLPGIPPTSRHIADLAEIISRQDVRFILQDVYHSEDAGKHLATRFSVRFVRLPHDVNAVKEADSIFSLLDEMVRRFSP